MFAFPTFSRITKKVITSVHCNAAVIKNFMIYAGGSLILRSISLLLAPITLTLLSPADYGLLALVQSFTNIFVVFLGLGLRQVFALEYFHHTSEQRKRMLHEILGIYLAVSIPLLTVMAWQAPRLNRLIFMGHATNSLLYASLLFCFLYFFAELIYQTLQYQCRAVALTALQTAVALITISCNITALKLGLNVTGMVCGYSVGMLCSGAYGVYRYLRYHHTRYYLPSLEKAWYYLPLGLPFMPSVLFGWLLSSGSRWMLARYGSLHDVGIYALADTVGALFQMLVLYPMSGSYLPYLFKKFAAHKDNLAPIEAWNKKNMWWSMAAMTGLVTLGYAIGKPILGYFVPASYHQAFDYMWFILIANIFLMGTYFGSALIQFHKKTYQLLGCLAVPALVNLLIARLLIPLYGLHGGIIALVTAYCSYFIVTLYHNELLIIKMSQEQRAPGS